MKITAKITKILEVQKGESKEGKEWQKVSFVATTDESYNNLYCFEVFGVEKVENFLKFNKVNDIVSVEFNVSTNEWQGKYYTSLQAWLIKKASVDDVDVNDAETLVGNKVESLAIDDLPF